MAFVIHFMFLSFGFVFVFQHKETARIVRQFHFHHWTEGSNVPSSKMALLELLELVDTWQTQFHHRPVTVHCMYVHALCHCHVKGARCSSVVRAFAHGAMGRRIDPSWGGPIEPFLVPASDPGLL